MQPQNFRDLVGILLNLIEFAIPVVFGLAILAFVWGLTKSWIIGGANEADVSNGRQIAFWGIIVFALMVGLWGVLAILRTTFFG